MSSINVFIIFLLVSVVGMAVYSFWGKDLDYIKSYFKGDTGKGILKGIALAVIIPVLISLFSGCAATKDLKWGGDTSVFVGAEYVSDNPFCVKGSHDDLVSNLGLKQQFVETRDEKLKGFVKWTHHSCVFGEDADNYDAFPSIEFESIIRKGK